MVYRIAGVYRRRIDEILPFFPGARLEEGPEETVLCVRAAEPLGGNADVRSMPAGFYVHWWSSHERLDQALGDLGIDEQELRNIAFHSIGRWTEDLYQREVYADFGRKSGDLTVGRYRLVPFAAAPQLSAQIIQDGVDEIVVLRQRVEQIMRERLPKAAAERSAKR